MPANKPFEMDRPPTTFASPPQAPCLPLKGSVRPRMKPHAKMRKTIIFPVMLLTACTSAQPVISEEHDPKELTPAMRREVQRLAQDPQAVTNMPISRVQYLGKEAFLVTSPCCDQFNYLYDQAAKVLCAPTGGFAGQGDGRCKGPISPPLGQQQAK